MLEEDLFPFLIGKVLTHKFEVIYKPETCFHSL